MESYHINLILELTNYNLRCRQRRFKSLDSAKKYKNNNPHVEHKYSADAVLSPPKNQALIKTTDIIEPIGVSSRGTDVLQVFIQAIPLDIPRIVILQHIPEHFTRSISNRLYEICQITIKS